MKTLFVKFDIATGAVTNVPIALPSSGSVVLELHPLDVGVQRALDETNTLVLELFTPTSIDFSASPLAVKEGSTYVTNGQFAAFQRNATDKSHRQTIDLDTVTPSSDTLFGRVRFTEDGGDEIVGAFFHIQTGGVPGNPAVPVTLTEVQAHIAAQVNQASGLAKLDDSGNLITRSYPPIMIAGELAAGLAGGYFIADVPCQVLGIAVTSMADAPTDDDLEAKVVDEADGELVAADILVLDGADRGRWLFDAPLILAVDDVIACELTQVGSTNPGAFLAAAWIIQPKQQS